MAETAVMTKSLLCCALYSGAVLRLGIAMYTVPVRAQRLVLLYASEQCVTLWCCRCYFAAPASTRLRTAEPARCALPANTTATRDWRPVPFVSFFAHVLCSVELCAMPVVAALCFCRGSVRLRRRWSVLAGQHHRVRKLPRWYVPSNV